MIFIILFTLYRMLFHKILLKILETKMNSFISESIVYKFNK